MRRTTDPRDAARAIAAGRLAALPTETVYGLGARADDPHAIARVYAAKGRPADHPLIAHVAGIDALDAWASGLHDYARALVQARWPGPLTIVVARSDRAGDFITGGQDSVAVRCSSHPLMRSVLEELIAITGDPAIAIAAPSANRFGRVSPTTAEHVLEEFAGLSDDDVVLDGGDCEVGVESTIIDCTGEHPRLLRPGAISADDVAAITGLPCTTGSTVRASGTLDSHYAPTARVELRTAAEIAGMGRVADDARTGLIALADVPTPPGIVRLTAPADAEAYARSLYMALREADALGLATVLAVPPPPNGVGAAVIDRLTRAAH